MRNISELSKAGIKYINKYGLWDTVKHFVQKLLSKILQYTRKSDETIGKEKKGLEEYVRYVEHLNYLMRNPSDNPDFCEYDDRPFVRCRNDAKIVAWYLPQYYQMTVNDKYHGKGFTEWTCVTRSIPLFAGHMQPRLPYDVGFYTLNNTDILRRQIELAKHYGIYGFCFDWYWFSGIRTMEKPVEMFLNDKSLDINFCINWCTENWTALWDGDTKEVIFEQKLRNRDSIDFFRDLLPLISDERYIRVNNKPLIMIYMVNMFEKSRFVNFLNDLRINSKNHGFEDLYIMITTAGGFNGIAKEWGADAIVEYPTINMGDCDRLPLPEYVNPNFKSRNNILEYNSFVEEKRFYKDYKEKNVFRSAMVNFDNSSRKGYSQNCWIIKNSNPHKYKEWLKNIVAELELNRNRDERLAFVLAWNEWAESATLEPDLYWGYSYLQATKDALEETRKEIKLVDDQIVLENIQKLKDSGIEEIDFYIHCIESLGDVIACEPIARYLKSLEPKSHVHWIVRSSYSDVVKYNSYIDESIVVECLSESIKLIKEYRKNPTSIIIDCHQNGRRCVVTNEYHWNANNPQIDEYTYLEYGSLLNNFCYSAGLPALNDAPVFHLKNNICLDIELPEKYIVVHCKSAETCKDWETRKWKQLVNELISKGCNVVEVGLTSLVDIDREGFIDCTNIHDIQKIAYIIKSSSIFIGIDSAFAHIANAFAISGILILGKYKSFENTNMYSGMYGKDENVERIYADSNGPAKCVSVEEVMKAYEKIRSTWK